MVGPTQDPIELLVLLSPPSNAPGQTVRDSLTARLRAVEAPSCWQESPADEESKASALQGKTGPVSLRYAGGDETEVAFRISEDALSRLEAGLLAQGLKQTSRAARSPVTDGSDTNLAANCAQSEVPVLRSSFRPLLCALIVAAIIVPVAYHLFPRGAPTAVAADNTEPAEAPSVPVATEPPEANPNPQSQSGPQPSLGYHAVSAPSAQAALGPLTLGPSAPEIEGPIGPEGTTGSGRTHHTRLARHTAAPDRRPPDFACQQAQIACPHNGQSPKTQQRGRGEQ